jgi:hypothetical protein
MSQSCFNCAYLKISHSGGWHEPPESDASCIHPIEKDTWEYQFVETNLDWKDFFLEIGSRCVAFIPAPPELDPIEDVWELD